MKRDRYGNDITPACWTCRYHRHEHIDDEWICTNTASEYCTDYTDADDACDEWEER